MNDRIQSIYPKRHHISSLVPLCFLTRGSFGKPRGRRKRTKRLVCFFFVCHGKTFLLEQKTCLRSNFSYTYILNHPPPTHIHTQTYRCIHTFIYWFCLVGWWFLSFLCYYRDIAFGILLCENISFLCIILLYMYAFEISAIMENRTLCILYYAV